MSAIAMGSLKGYAKFMRAVRSRQPKVSSAEAHAQARRALATVGQQKGKAASAPLPATAPTTSPKKPATKPKTPGSSAGQGGTDD